MVDQVEKDFGESFVESQGVTLSCRNIAPGLTLHELAVAFEKAKNEAEPGDEVAGNPSKWPNVRGIQAVVDAMNNAYSAYNPNERLREALEACRDKFREYEGLHTLKLRDYKGKEPLNYAAELQFKINSNREMAEMCDAALTPPSDLSE